MMGNIALYTRIRHRMKECLGCLNGNFSLERRWGIMAGHVFIVLLLHDAV